MMTECEPRFWEQPLTPPTPSPFVFCPNCVEARQVGGKSLRNRSSFLINSELLIDLSPDSVKAALSFGESLSSVRILLQTHPHADHFDPNFFFSRIAEYKSDNPQALEIVASGKTLERMSSLMAAQGYLIDLLTDHGQQEISVKVHPIRPLERLELGPYTITAFEANHDPSVDCLLYGIQSNHLSILYATDTDTIPENTWAGFEQLEMHFDVVILDHTYGFGSDGGGHLNAERFVQQVSRMKSEGILREGARVLATHFSHEGNPPHETLSNLISKLDYEAAWDGMVLELS